MHNSLKPSFLSQKLFFFFYNLLTPHICIVFCFDPQLVLLTLRELLWELYSFSVSLRVYWHYRIYLLADWWLWAHFHDLHVDSSVLFPSYTFRNTYCHLHTPPRLIDMMNICQLQRNNTGFFRAVQYVKLMFLWAKGKTSHLLFTTLKAEVILTYIFILSYIHNHLENLKTSFYC